MAESQESTNPKIEMLKVLDSVIHQIENDLASAAQLVDVTLKDEAGELVVEPELEQFESSLDNDS